MVGDSSRISRTMSSGFRLVSCLRASSLEANRRAVVERALRAMKEAIVSDFWVENIGVEGDLTLGAGLQILVII